MSHASLHAMLNIHQAWRALRDATAFDWAASQSLTPVAVTPTLTLSLGGCWQCSGPVDDAARQLLDALAPVACSGSPVTLAQLGQSIDGRIATVSGASHYVTGEQGLVHLHRLRALVDAVVVGAGTVAADDPRLTVRHVEGQHPLRVVLDPRARLSPHHRLFQEHEAPVLYLTAGQVPSGFGAHVETASIHHDGERVAPAEVLAILHARGCQRVLIEGGGVTISRFVAAGVLDRLHAVVAPMLIGSGRPALVLPEIDTLEDALRPACRTHLLGADVLFDLDLRASTSTQPPDGLQQG